MNVLLRGLIVVAITALTSTQIHASSLDFALGKALFERIWTPAPSSTDATDGLGPLFNARACASCHADGGRGEFHEDADGSVRGLGLLLRLGDELGEPDKTYGSQLQTLAVQGHIPEGQAVREPSGHLTIKNLGYGPMAPTTRVGGRLSPSLRGLGALSRVDEREILTWSDPDDTNKDGISGRPNRVTDKNGQLLIGRFGWKAGKHSISQQSAAALHGDLGLSSALFSDHAGDCTPAQHRCHQAPHGASERFDGYEIGNQMLDLIVTYVAGLKPPLPLVKNDTGLKHFYKIGCAQCHRPQLALANGELLAAYSDLLLHDMGGDLADGIGDGSATGSEWRTAPLWGMRYATRFLHDGRADNLKDAIAHHGGEALNSSTAFFMLSGVEQDQLINFLSEL